MATVPGADGPRPAAQVERLFVDVEDLAGVPLLSAAVEVEIAARHQGGQHFSPCLLQEGEVDEDVLPRDGNCGIVPLGQGQGRRKVDDIRCHARRRRQIHRFRGPPHKERGQVNCADFLRPFLAGRAGTVLCSSSAIIRM